MRTNSRFFLAFVLVGLFMGPTRTLLVAAGTVTVTTAVISGSSVTRYTIAWTSTAGGAVSANTFSVKAGHLIEIKFVPGSAGNQPTDLYDVTLIDTDSIDLLSGRGANLSNATSSRMVWDPPLYHDATQAFDLVVANAGNAKSGTVILYVE